jgi:N-acetylglucosamine kinase-like BadF-type ATPase
VGIYLGIDGGGSKTAWAIGDEHSVIASGVVGPSNFVRVGEDRAREALLAAITQACAVAGVKPSQVQRACLGLAGAGQEKIRTWAQSTVREVFSGEIYIVGDMVTAHQAAFQGGPGAIVIAGTGSIAFARNARGETARAGGWGFAISDEGSGHWIGRKAISAALRAADERNEIPLQANLLQCWKLNRCEQLAAAANASPPPDFASLVPAVTASAEAEDAIASAVLESAGIELGDIAAVVIRRALSPDPRVAMSGGVFRHSRHVRESFFNRIRGLYPRAHIVSDVVDPIDGALALARSARVAEAASS